MSFPNIYHLRQIKNSKNKNTVGKAGILYVATDSNGGSRNIPKGLRPKFVLFPTKKWVENSKMIQTGHFCIKYIQPKTRHQMI